MYHVGCVEGEQGKGMGRITRTSFTGIKKYLSFKILNDVQFTNLKNLN